MGAGEAAIGVRMCVFDVIPTGWILGVVAEKRIKSMTFYQVYQELSAPLR